MDLSVVVPVFHGENTIPELLEKIEKTLNVSFSFEVIFVHDGGTDLSWGTICKLRKLYGPLVRGIKLTRNFGQHNAVLCGIEHAGGRLIATMDEDLQHNPENLIDLINCQKENDSDLVYGSYSQRNHSILRNSLSWLLRSLLTILMTGLNKEYTSYRLIKKEIADKISHVTGSNVFLDGSLARLNIKVSIVRVPHCKSGIGESSYTFTKLIKHTFKTLFSFFSFWANNREKPVTGKNPIYMVEEII